MGGHIRDLSGQTFGELLVLNKISPTGHAKYLCQCSCGKKKIISGANLVNGHTKSCGHLVNTPAYNFHDLTGMQFGSLSVISVSYRKNGKVYYLCQCVCGKRKVVVGSALKSGNTRSCGCKKKEFSSQALLTHGGANTRLFRIWTSMKNRCYNPNDESSFLQYGGRGITVCKEWSDSFEAFRNWALSNGYDENALRGECTIDRIDVNGNYCPENCRWVSMKEQANNKRNNHKIEYNGETHTISEWCTLLHIPKHIIYSGLKYGHSFAEIVESPHLKRTSISFNGETHSASKWSELYGLNKKTVARRLERGWSIKDAITTPAYGKDVKK